MVPTNNRGAALAVRRSSAANRFIAGETITDIAASIGVHKSTVSRWVDRAMQEQREALDASIEQHRAISHARYQKWLSEELGDSDASRQTRIRLQARIDKILGLEDTKPPPSTNVTLLQQVIAEATHQPLPAVLIEQA